MGLNSLGTIDSSGYIVSLRMQCAHYPASSNMYPATGANDCMNPCCFRSAFSPLQPEFDNSRIPVVFLQGFLSLSQRFTLVQNGLAGPTLLFVFCIQILGDFCDPHLSSHFPEYHAPLVVRHPVRELHFRGLTRQVGVVCWMVSWDGGGCVQHLHSPGGSCSPFSTGRGVVFSKLCSPGQVMGGRRTHSVSALLLVFCTCWAHVPLIAAPAFRPELGGASALTRQGLRRPRGHSPHSRTGQSTVSHLILRMKPFSGKPLGGGPTLSVTQRMPHMSQRRCQEKGHSIPFALKLC